MTVAEAELVPGVRIRMAGIEPPYSAPTYTLANKTKALVASIPTVKGNSNAMAMEGEMPGKAPPKMPHNTPANADKMTQPDDRLERANKKLSMIYFPIHCDHIPVGKRISNA